MAQIMVDESKMTEVGMNVLATELNDKIVIVIQKDKQIGLSSTGKMMGIASTGGFTALPGGLKGNIYIGRKV